MEQWQVSRELYVVLERRRRRRRRRPPPRLGGRLFGEIAAIDWGAGFARTRTATVTATMSTRLLVLDWTLVNWLMTAEPEFRARLERSSCERLAAVSPSRKGRARDVPPCPVGQNASLEIWARLGESHGGFVGRLIAVGARWETGVGAAVREDDSLTAGRAPPAAYAGLTASTREPTTVTMRIRAFI